MGSSERECDVVVVGAGLAGLTAAWHLDRVGLDVVVVEARDRVGGRSWTTSTQSGCTVDRGGQWIGPTQHRLQALADRLGVTTFPTYTVGEGVEWRSGVRHTYSGLIPTSDPRAAADAVEAILDLDLAALEVPLEAPWAAERADELDATTLGAWLDENLESPVTRQLLGVAVKAVFGTGPGELSLLFALFYLHAGGGLSNLVRTTGGAQERRFVGGSQQLAEGLAGELGDRVLLGAPVEAVDYGPEHVAVTVGGGGGALPGTPVDGHPARVRARRAVVALSPTLTARLRWSPDLPARRDQLCQRMPMGSVTKIHALYDRPFWRDDGLNGQLVAYEGALSSTFDDSPPDAAHGGLVGFIAGAECRRFEQGEPGARRAAVLDELARAFGPRAARPIELVVQHWPAEAHTRGGPVAVSSPGALTGFGTALREPVAAIHWAGTETATEWCGYLEGALASGERAAGEVGRALGVAGGPGGDDGHA